MYGVKIGGTPNGYIGFDADISNIVKFDSLNIIAVRSTTYGNSRCYINCKLN